MEKFCNRCKTWKDISEFTKNAAVRCGYNSRCKPCFRAYRASLCDATGYDKIRQHNRHQSIKNTWVGFYERHWNYINSRTVNGSRPQITQRRCRQYIQRGIMICFTRAEFKKWCELNKDVIESQMRDGLRPSIDRKDPDGHYTLDNMQILPFLENIRKIRRGDDRKDIIIHRQVPNI